MLVPFSLLRATIEMDVNGQQGTPTGSPPPTSSPNISLTGNRTPIIPSNAIEL